MSRQMYPISTPQTTDSHEPETSNTSPFGRGLPLPKLQPPRTTDALYTVRPIDYNSRVQALGVLPVLDWRGGDRLRWQVKHNLIVVTRLDPDSRTPGDSAAITRMGHLRLPAQSRHAARLRIGDRVLLAAGLIPDALIIWPMPILDDALLPHATVAATGRLV